MNALVSVIVPIYNVEQYMDRCVESIVNQTYENLEIILVDDGSTDMCSQKCDEWAIMDQRIKVIHKINEGIGFARNSGLEIASGEYIMFVDSDDYLLLEAIEIMLQQMLQDRSDMVAAQRTKVYPDGREEALVLPQLQNEVIDRQEALRRLYCKHKPFRSSAWGKLYKKHVFNEVRFTNLKTAEDTRAVPDIIDQCNKISIMKDVVYYYFQRETSVVHTKTTEKQLDNLKAVLYVARFLFDRNYIKEAGHYYYAAVCDCIKMNENKVAKQLIDSSFNTRERKLLRQNLDADMLMSILVARFPSLYQFYKKYVKMWNV